MFFANTLTREQHLKEYQNLDVQCSFKVYHRTRLNYPRKSLQDIVTMFDPAHIAGGGGCAKIDTIISGDEFKYQAVYYNKNNRRVTFLVAMTSYLHRLNIKCGFTPYSFGRNLKEGADFINKSGGKKQAAYYLNCFYKEVIPPNTFGFGYVYACIKPHWNLSSKSRTTQKRTIDI